MTRQGHVTHQQEVGDFRAEVLLSRGRCMGLPLCGKLVMRDNGR